MPEQKKQTKNILRRKVLFVGYRFMITLSLYLFLYSFTIRSFLYTGTENRRRITLLTVIFRTSNKKRVQKARGRANKKYKIQKM